MNEIGKRVQWLAQNIGLRDAVGFECDILGRTKGKRPSRSLDGLKYKFTQVREHACSFYTKHIEAFL